MMEPYDALKKTMTALGFEVRGHDIVHVESGITLRSSWSEAAAEDLKHFNGVNAAQELATMLMEQLWAVATTGKPKYDDPQFPTVFLKVTIEGKLGTGKTTVASAIADALEKFGYVINYQPAEVRHRMPVRDNANFNRDRAKRTVISIIDRQSPRDA